jgi:hypothetical protein
MAHINFLARDPANNGIACILAPRERGSRIRKKALQQDCYCSVGCHHA